MTLEDLTKIINEKFEFCKARLGEKESLTDKYLALTGITQLVGGKTIEELFEDAEDDEKEKIAGKLAWCVPGGTGMGGTNEDALKPKSEVETEVTPGTDEPEPVIEPEEPVVEPEPQTYTITFMNGEEVVKTVTGETGTTVSAPDVEKEGYDFNGWSINGETPILPVDAITDTDITYVALWYKEEPEVIEGGGEGPANTPVEGPEIP